MVTRPIPVHVLVDWNSELRALRTPGRNEGAEIARRTLKFLCRRVGRLLHEQSESELFFLFFRVYHGWRTGSTPTLRRQSLEEARVYNPINPQDRGLVEYSRPFFLEVIAREPEALRNDELPASDLLSYLVNVMTQREAEKFVESLDPPNGREATAVYAVYVGRFLEEVARDMAENQSDAIADEALDLLATVAAHGLLPEDQIAAVVQRARTVVFLANDVQVGHVRFAHEQLQQHFLSREALRSIGEGETPRYVRRNLFGREALEVFAHVARGRTEETHIFLRAVRAGIDTPSRDRTDANLSVLGVAAACGAAPDNADLHIRNVGLSELHFPFSPPPGISIQDSVISILHAASADLRNVRFEGGVEVATLVVDRRTLLPSEMPIPQTLTSHKGSTAKRSEIIRSLRADTEGESSGVLTWSVGLAELLGRIERYRPFWLRTNIEDTDPQGRRIISHEDWPTLFDALKNLDLITVKFRQAAGVRADFVHFRQDVRLAEHAGLNHALGIVESS